MKEVKSLERYEIRLGAVWDKTEKRLVTLKELKAAMEFWATAKVVLEANKRNHPN